MKKLLLVLMTLMQVNLFAWDGEGTKESPYLIKNVQDLISLSESAAAGNYYDYATYFKVVANVLDFSDIEKRGNGSNFTPILDFHGNFDGNGCVIQHMIIHEESNAGLFAKMSGYVENITIDNTCSITSDNGYAGSIAGRSEMLYYKRIDYYNGQCVKNSIINCVNYSPITGLQCVGGIVGSGSVDSITHCTNYGIIKQTGNSGSGSGGIVGGLSLGIIEDNINHGEVYGYKEVGGICGFAALLGNYQHSQDYVRTNEFTQEFNRNINTENVTAEKELGGALIGYSQGDTGGMYGAGGEESQPAGADNYYYPCVTVKSGSTLYTGSTARAVHYVKYVGPGQKPYQKVLSDLKGFKLNSYGGLWHSSLDNKQYYSGCLYDNIKIGENSHAYYITIDDNQVQLHDVSNEIIPGNQVILIEGDDFSYTTENSTASMSDNILQIAEESIETTQLNGTIYIIDGDNARGILFRKFTGELRRGQVFFVADSDKETFTLFEGNPSLITFTDPVVKAICVEHWDADGDGELSEAEAAAVETLDGVFRYNQEITSFDELRYFTGLTEINGDFHNCSKLTSIIIPDNVTKITAVSDYYWHLGAFAWCYDLTSVTLGENVEIIGNYSFEGCYALSSVNIPHSVRTIGYQAFWNCEALATLTIPSNVESIGDMAFEHCSGLTSIVVEEGNKNYDSRDNCNALIETSTNTLLLGSNNSFVPNTVKNIANDAFFGCRGLTSLTIPKSVVTIGPHAFTWCSGLNSIIVEEGNPTYDSRDNCNALIKTANDSLISGSNNTIIPHGVKKIAPYAFTGRSGMTSLTIPSSITSIGELAFASCSGPNLLSIMIEEGNTVYDSRNNCNAIIETATNSLIFGCKNTIILDDIKVIGPDAFRGGSNIISVSIPNSVRTIGERAFYDCSGLTSVVIGKSVQVIESAAFYGCPNLQDVYCYAENVPDLRELYGMNVFSLSDIGNTTLHVPAASIDAYSADDTWKQFGNIVALEDSDPKPTAITSVTQNTKVGQQYYSLDGKRIAAPQRGMNIVKMSDGTTRKVMVK